MALGLRLTLWRLNYGDEAKWLFSSGTGSGGGHHSGYPGHCYAGFAAFQEGTFRRV
jgi:hypothetical protein